MSVFDRSKRSDRGRGRVARAVVRAMPPLAVAAFLWWRGHRRAPVVLAAVAITLFVLGLLFPRVAEWLDRAVARLAAGAAHGLTVLLAGAAWTVALLPVWGISRLARYSPLESGWTGERTAWTFVDRARLRSPDLRVDRPHRSGQTELRAAPRVRRRGAVRLVPFVVAVVALGAWTVERRTAPPVQAQIAELAGRAPLVRGEAMDLPDNQLQISGYPVTDYAHEDEPWFRDYARELLGYNTLPDLILGARNGEFTGNYLNIVDGHRVSYTSDDPALEVWFFGGSTIFGIGQRDDHTIPSVVARLAERDGIRIRATNFGVAGDVNWQGTLRFAEALDDPDLPDPDLVVFYDGVNDFGLASTRVAEGAVDPATSSRLPVSEAERAQRSRAIPDWVEPPQDFGRGELEIELAAAQYARGVRTARRLAEATGVPVVHFWQPQPFAKVATPADDELYQRLGFPKALLPATTRTYREIRIRSGVSPIDLTDAFDDVAVPIFFDSSHTNELGARIVATRIYEELRPLRAAQEAG